MRALGNHPPKWDTDEDAAQAGTVLVETSGWVEILLSQMEVGTMETFPLLDETPVGAVRQQSRM